MPTLLLDPAHPLLWRDAETVQFGPDAILTLSAGEAWVERLLHALRAGIPELSFDLVAYRCGAPRAAARALRERLAPVLIAPPEPHPVQITVLPEIDPQTTIRLGEALIDSGLRAAAPEDGSATLVPVAAGVCAAADSATALADDRPHLPLSFDTAGATIGPLVVPGRTPCLSCRDAGERDHDPAWAAVHTQMLRQPPGRVPLRRIAAAADALAQLLSEHAEAVRHGSSRVVRITADGRRASRSVSFHADCRCRSLPGTATLAAPRARIPATSSPPAFARPA